MPNTVTLIPGDGIGPEVSTAVQEIVRGADAQIEWEEMPPRAKVEKERKDYLECGVLDSIRRNRVALKGPMATEVAGGRPSINVGLRKALDLYANVRPVKSVDGVKTPFANVDLVLIRENTEDLYSGLEHTVVPGVVESLKIITERASTRIAQFAFEYARRSGRRKIHGIHKANIMKLSDGLFLSCLRRVAAEYPDIEYKELIIHNACMQVVLNPGQFDLLLSTNLYGDIMSDLAAALVGGLGVVPSANIGENAALFEAVHGTAPDIAGKGVANPTALLMSAILMLDHMSERKAACRIERALHAVYREGKTLTPDVGGTATTTQFTQAVIRALS